MKVLGILLLIIQSSHLHAGNPDADTIFLIPGQCYIIETGYTEPGSYSWNTGNQDIAVINNTGNVCGVGEGITYVSFSSASSNVQQDFIIKVIDPDIIKNGAPVTPLTYHFSIDADVNEVLRVITNEKSYGDLSSQLTVSANKRYLVYRKTGKPFLFLGQTLWSITRRLTREEIAEVLDISKEQGFTAIQLIAHTHYMGPNRYGDTPFEGENFLRPAITKGNSVDTPDEYDWWDHLEFIIEECIKRELFVCLLPTWREQWNQKKNLHEYNAFAYGKFIGERYRHFNPWIIWVMGGDHHPNTPEYMNLHRELAKGVAFGINGEENYDNLMMTYHTHGPTSSVDYFDEDEPFMDFNTIQSGHGLNNLEEMIEKAYQAQLKPVMDFEPYYTKDGKSTNEARTIIYWGIFSGGFGTSYGSWNIWHCGVRNDLAEFNIPDAFYEGFGPQVKYLARLLTSYPMLSRIPDQNILANNHTKGLDRILACGSVDKSYIMVYTPKGEEFTVKMSDVEGKKYCWYWYNPRNGEIVNQKVTRKKASAVTFYPPTSGERFSGNDWVLVISQSRKFKL